MGTRINKVLGFGVPDITEYWPSFERDYYEKTEDQTIGSVLENSEEYNSIISDEGHPLHRHVKYNRWSNDKCLYDLIHFQAESKKPVPCVFWPFDAWEDWKRYSDVIDVFEFQAKHEFLDVIFESQHTNLYPYHKLMKFENGDPTPILYWESCWMDKPDAAAKIPYVPYEIYLMLKHLGAPDPFKIYINLRASVLVHWS